ncbi:MAG: cytochrome c [Flavobacteriaceae bacterium]|nr:cytochrome c [Flavobacteriaceae bacterium]
MKTLKPVLFISLAFVVSLSFMSMKTTTYKVSNITSICQDTLKWVAPVSADAITNPYEVNDENISYGALTYKKNCRSCHGRHGDGKGMEAETLETIPTSFLSETFAKQSDGAIFWKINKGKNEMKSYTKKLEEEDIWNVIMYIKKTFIESSK